MTRWLLAAVVWCFATAGWAKAVAVAPVIYRTAQGDEAAQAGDKVRKAVLEGVRKAGFDAVVEGVDDAVATESVDGSCDAACYERVCRRLGVDDVLAVSVVDDDQVRFDVTLALGRSGVRKADERVAGFFVVLEWIKGEVALLLDRMTPLPPEEPVAADRGDGEAAPAAAPAEVSPADDAPDAAQSATAPQEEGGSRRLSKTPFVATVTAAMALGVAALVVDGVANHRFNRAKDAVVLDDLSDPQATIDQAADDARGVRRLQIAEVVLWSAAGAAAVTAAVLAAFTDFGSEQTVVTPVAAAGGAGVVFSHSF